MELRKTERGAMTFEEVLDQAIAMLRRRGRVTYRTLKRQFQLDDAALEDLTVELIKGQRLAVEEDGDVLVWAGRAADAVPLLMQATEQATATEMLVFQALCHLALGEAQVLAGRLEEAHPSPSGR